jgi:NAD(P)-dependent dehydrogenase (short-subunit alcohol dehydrogenase family)
MDSAVKIENLFDVRGLSVLVTGAASGVGFGYAEALAANGAHVTLTDVDPAALEAAVRKLRDAGGKAWGQPADVTQPETLRAAMAVAVAREGRLDVVFANAGVSAGPGFLRGDGTRNPDGALENLSMELFQRALQINLVGALNTLQAATPHMKKQGTGRIVVTSTVSTIKTETLVSTLYVASKAGLLQLVRQAALELAAYGITVNGIAPGPVITNIGGGRLRDPAARAPFERVTPLKRLASPHDLYGTALFLASPSSSYITGIQITVDGGLCLGMVD